MGLFNDVLIKEAIPCPNCGSKLYGWQTKDMIYAGYDLANTLQRLKLNKQMIGSIHTSCTDCNQWIEYGVIKGTLVSRKEYEQYLKLLQVKMTGKTDEELRRDTQFIPKKKAKRFNFEKE